MLLWLDILSDSQKFTHVPFFIFMKMNLFYISTKTLLFMFNLLFVVDVVNVDFSETLLYWVLCKEMEMKTFHFSTYFEIRQKYFILRFRPNFSSCKIVKNQFDRYVRSCSANGEPVITVALLLVKCLLWGTHVLSILPKTLCFPNSVYKCRATSFMQGKSNDSSWRCFQLCHL